MRLTAVIALLFFAAIVSGCTGLMADSGANPRPPRPYCSFQAVPGCVP